MYVGELTRDQYRALPLGVRLRLAASDLLGWRYKTGSDVRFPAARNGLAVPSSMIDPDGPGIDCSSLTAYLLMTAYPEAPWNGDRYGELQIFDAAEPWSPIDAVEQAGVGSRVSAPVAGTWHLTQTWKSLNPLSGGHARLAYASPTDADQLLVLESSSRSNGIGPRFSRTRWSDLLAKYQEARAAALGPG